MATMGDPEGWTGETTGRERVRAVVETLDEPATVSEVADRADVAWATADDELGRLVDAGRVREVGEGSGTRYEPDPVRLLLDEIVALIREHEREELASRLVECQSRLEALREDHGVETAAALRRRLGDDGRSADEMRELRRVASTWEALETERRLLGHALELYDDVAALADPDGEAGLILP